MWAPPRRKEERRGEREGWDTERFTGLECQDWEEILDETFDETFDGQIGKQRRSWLDDWRSNATDDPGSRTMFIQMSLFV